MTRLERVVFEEDVSLRDGERISAKRRRMYLLLEKADRSAAEGSYEQAAERYRTASNIADELGLRLDRVWRRINAELYRRGER